ncbi:MAG: helix-hairpin-helix domain-containing protein, partial [Halobacteriaceae archaeon]
ANKLIAEIDASREPNLSNFIAAIGVPEVGPTVARDIARHFKTFDAVLNADPDDLQDVEGVGETMATEIHAFFQSEQNRQAIESLREHVDVQPVQETAGEELSNLTIVFTGSIEGWTRDELRELIERHGGSHRARCLPKRITLSWDQIPVR